MSLALREGELPLSFYIYVYVYIYIYIYIYSFIELLISFHHSSSASKERLPLCLPWWPRALHRSGLGERHVRYWARVMGSYFSYHNRDLS